MKMKSFACRDTIKWKWKGEDYYGNNPVRMSPFSVSIFYLFYFFSSSKKMQLYFGNSMKFMVATFTLKFLLLCFLLFGLEKKILNIRYVTWLGLNGSAHIKFLITLVHICTLPRRFMWGLIWAWKWICSTRA